MLPSVCSPLYSPCFPFAELTFRAVEQLDKSKVTGIKQVDTLQDGVHGLVAGQVGQGGLLQPVGDLVSKEGVNRAERQGKDDKGGYLPDSVSGGLSSVQSGASNVPVVGGLFGGKK